MQKIPTNPAEGLLMTKKLGLMTTTVGQMTMTEPILDGEPQQGSVTEPNPTTPGEDVLRDDLELENLMTSSRG